MLERGGTTHRLVAHCTPVGAKPPEGCTHEDAIDDGEREPHSIVARVAPVADSALPQQHAVLPDQALRMLRLKQQLLRARVRLTQPVYQRLNVPVESKEWLSPLDPMSDPSSESGQA